MSTPETDTSLRIIIDALQLARNEVYRHYEFRGKRFKGLSGILVSDEPVLDINLQFGLQQGKTAISGQLTGVVELVCQRCLNSMPYSLDERFALLLSNAEESKLGSEVEDEVDDLEYQSSEWEEWITDVTRLDLVQLVEEQVILALPLIAKHGDERHCVVSRPIEPDSDGQADHAGKKVSTSAGVDGTEPRRPFENLRELLNK